MNDTVTAKNKNYTNYTDNRKSRQSHKSMKTHHALLKMFTGFTASDIGICRDRAALGGGGVHRIEWPGYPASSDTNGNRQV